MRVRDHDVTQLVRPTAERAQCLQHEPGVALEERVDERQLVAVVDEERSYAAALLAAEGVHAGHELPQAPPTCLHGAKPFVTPFRAGARSGKWRSSTVIIDASAIQSSPSCVYVFAV